ncbi:excisionase family DNA-binding protein [Nocardiopsis baichengensis]|uniref:excisionase family DNA-binding protein n=1 Tax=Nocardiopsis baichengensis TaxID=280240 RepID=UPI000349DF2F|nr:excisionase family DNA-binding protein [Nocardiopsis baichengensis]
MSNDAAAMFGKPYLTVQETAELLHMSRWKVFDLLRTGDLPSFKPGRHRLIPAAGLHSFVSQRLDEEAA